MYMWTSGTLHVKVVDALLLEMGAFGVPMPLQSVLTSHAARVLLKASELSVTSLVFSLLL